MVSCETPESNEEISQIELYFLSIHGAQDEHRVSYPHFLLLNFANTSKRTLCVLCTHSSHKCLFD